MPTLHSGRDLSLGSKHNIYLSKRIQTYVSLAQEIGFGSAQLRMLLRPAEKNRI
jgi:hypothetical protein